MNIPLPAKLETTGNLPTNWKRFKRDWENYELATRLKDPANPTHNKELRTATFLTCMGSEALDIFDSLDFDSEDHRKDIDVVIDKLNKHCIGKTNETYERYIFNQRVQEPNETVDTYVTALKKLSKTCNFGNLEESLIRDKIVIGVRDTAARKRLLERSELTLKNCIDICRSFETTKKQLKTIDNDEEVHAITKKAPSKWEPRERTMSKPRLQQQHKRQEPKLRCFFCGNTHIKNRRQCPAWGQTCRKCGKENHFAKVCQGQTREQRRQEVNAVDDDDEYESDEYIAYVSVKEHIGQVGEKEFDSKLTAIMLLNGQEEKMYLDSGATVNVLSQETCTRLYGMDSLRSLHPTNTVLIMYNKSEERPLGKKRVQMVNPKNGKKYSVEFVIVKGSARSLLGAKASQQMKLLTANPANILAVDVTHQKQYTPVTREQILQEYSDVFKGEGCLEGKLQLQIDKSVPPVQLPTRKVPIAIKDNLKEELQRLTDLGVITPVDVPTEWISATVVTTKRNGKLRLCIDPQPLNKALKRNHYPLPTIDDILPDLSQARCFSVLDAKNGFWHVQLDDESSFLTTFSTPWGRYRWLRMPFGISPAPEEFQRRMDIALEGLAGIKAIADDILLFGSGATDEEAMKDHDTKLRNLLDRCRSKGLKLNESKLQLRKDQVAFMGHVITADGLRPDPEKVSAIVGMPSPTDKQAVQRLLGMVNYVQKFAPHLSEVTKPLRDLIKNDTEFLWDKHVHGKAFDETKKILSNAPILQYFNPEVQPVLQCDASQNGLGACLMQNGHPLAYASRSLTPTESNYAQIEKEMLAIVYGMEKFNTYVYGRKTLVESDHKPLETIFKRSLLSAPKRLQRMMLRLQRYEFEVTYKRGAKMYMADTLSRAYLPHHEVSSTDLEQVMTVNRTPTEKDVENINMCQFLPVTDETLSKIQKHTQQDQQLQTLKQVILQGWPDTIKKVKEEIHDYYPFRETLSVQNGIIFKGERVIIPYGLRDEIKSKLHASHLGIQGCLRRAREAFYWPRMNTEVEEYISKCSICNTFQAGQQKEPLMSHPAPSRPWEFIATDLFEFNGRRFLVTTDYFSNFGEVDRLYSTKSCDVINKLKSHFSRHGIPDRLISDNGPQFSSGEFTKFAADYQFQHITSSPLYPQSNGKAENAVNTVKRIMCKALESGTDPYLALLDFRNTPTEGIGTSPAQRLFGRRTKTLLPTPTKLLETSGAQNVTDKLRRSKNKQEYYYNRGTKELVPLEPGDSIRIKPRAGGKRWIKAEVDSQVNIRSYNVTTEQGQTYRRNRRHLRLTPETVILDPLPPQSSPEKPNTEKKETCPTPSADTSSQSEQPLPVMTAVQPSPQTAVERPAQVKQPADKSPPPKYSSRGREIRRPSHLNDFVPG